MSALQQTHGFPPTLTVLETRGAGQRRVFAQAPFHSCQGNPGRPQPKWLSGGASEPSSHGEKEGGGVLALAGRAHSAAAFPFSSQRKCFGRQIIPGDMKLLRPPHVARKKNHNEHPWLLRGNP